MRGLQRARWAAVAVTLGLTLAACGGGDDDAGGGQEPAPGETGAAGTGGGSYSIYVNNPENPLIPGNTNESEGSQIIEGLWTGLVQYNNETNELEYTGVAESIESEDSQEWTITLKDGWTFHDGTPVTAQSFVDAWNYTAYSPNAFGNSYFFANIEGYDDLQAEEGGGEPAAQEMSGLEVVDDRTFTVRLKEQFSQFPLTLGYNAFHPMPEAFFEDPEGFGAQPIGNGPFQAATAFEQDRGMTLERYDDYAGEDPAQAEQVEITVFSDVDTAYTEAQAGNLDVLPSLPPAAIGSAQDEFSGRFVERPSSAWHYLGFPTYDERFSDPRVRQAFSMAVDRDAITEAVFNGTRQPARSAISPVVAGHRENACEYCQQDVERAQQLLAETDFDTSQPVDLWFNAGAGHDEWVQAVGNQLRDAFGIEYNLRGDLEFAEYLPMLDEQRATGPFRLGWVMDYPSPQNYLEPMFTEEALPPNGSNYTFWTNDEFERLIDEANRTEDNDQAIQLYQQAEDILLEELPIMPMFFGVEQLVHSEDVSNVVITAFGHVDLSEVTVTQ